MSVLRFVSNLLTFDLRLGAEVDGHIAKAIERHVKEKKILNNRGKPSPLQDKAIGNLKRIQRNGLWIC